MFKILKYKLSIFLGAINVARCRLLGIQIGKNVYISRKAYIDTSYKGIVKIGDGSFISRGAYIIAHDASAFVSHGKFDGNHIGHIKIGKNVFIGVGATIFKDVTVGDNSVIRCGSVVFDDVPSGVVVSGNPAKIIKKLEIVDE